MLKEEEDLLLSLGKKYGYKVSESYYEDYHYVIYFLKEVNHKKSVYDLFVADTVLKIKHHLTYKECILKYTNSKIDLDAFEVFLSFEEGLNFLVSANKLSLEEAVMYRLTV